MQCEHLNSWYLESRKHYGMLVHWSVGRYICENSAFRRLGGAHFSAYIFAEDLQAIVILALYAPHLQILLY